MQEGKGRCKKAAHCFEVRESDDPVAVRVTNGELYSRVGLLLVP